MSHGPDFLCIGAQKAGTTWIYDNIKHHPGIWVPPSPYKELHYFDNRVPNTRLLHLGRYSHGGILKRYSPLLRSPNIKTLRWLWRFNHHCDDSMVWYRSLFDGQKGIRGDITPQYSTLDERGVEYVRKVVGERCKIFLVIREPVSRSWSAVKMLYRYKGIDIREEEPSKIIKEMQYPYTLLRSDYSRMISTWKTYFGNGEFRIFYYDDLIRDKIAFLDEICDYVGVSNTNWRSPTLNKVSNYDVQDIKIPMAVKIEMSRFFMPELEKLSNMVGGYTEDWLMKAKKITD